MFWDWNRVVKGYIENICLDFLAAVQAGGDGYKISQKHQNFGIS